MTRLLQDLIDDGVDVVDVAHGNNFVWGVSNVVQLVGLKIWSSADGNQPDVRLSGFISGAGGAGVVVRVSVRQNDSNSWDVASCSTAGTKHLVSHVLDGPSCVTAAAHVVHFLQSFEGIPSVAVHV